MPDGRHGHGFGARHVAETGIEVKAEHGAEYGSRHGAGNRAGVGMEM